MNAKAVIITLVLAVIGGTYIVLANNGPLKGMNFGFGLTSGLSQSLGIPGGYNMADLVVFVILLVVIGIVFLALNGMRKQKK
ncbi:MAG TPA: hypothetical protein VLX61_00560 [Anaerolineales bacterium]|nr:hypothetical protein [Anaerolineales bacterium]